MINRVLKIVLASSAAIMAVAAASLAAANSHSENPYSPTYGHEYRHGVMPSRETWKKNESLAGLKSRACSCHKS